MSRRHSFKVAIIGCGNVGMTTAYALLLRGIPTELILLSRDKAKVQGEDLDLEHGQPFMEKATVVGTDDYADLKNTDVVIITAGAAQKPGETRLDLTAKNKAIIEDIIPKIKEHAPQALVMLVSNPVDVLTYHAAKLFGGRPGQVFGSGTLLDTSRFRFHLSEALEINSRSIHTYILGEHGDSSFPALTSATVGGQPLLSLEGFSLEKAQAAYQKARNAAYTIIQGKGATYYGIATVLSHIVASIERDTRSVIPLSVPLENYHGISGVALSVPVILGRNGVSRTLEIELSEEEKQQLKNSAETIQQYL